MAHRLYILGNSHVASIESWTVVAVDHIYPISHFR